MGVSIQVYSIVQYTQQDTNVFNLESSNGVVVQTMVSTMTVFGVVLLKVCVKGAHDSCCIDHGKEYQG